MGQLTDTLYKRLPAIYRNSDTDDSLYNFLSVLDDGGLTLAKTDIDDFITVFDIDKSPSLFLDYLAAQISFEFPFTMTDTQKRKFLKVAPEIYRRKGTPTGLRYLLCYLLNWNVQIDNEDSVNRTYDIVLDAYNSDPATVDQKREAIDRIIQLYAPVATSYTLSFFFYYIDQYNIAKIDSYDDLINILVEESKDYGFTTESHYDSITMYDLYGKFIEQGSILLNSNYVLNSTFSTNDFGVRDEINGTYKFS